MATEDRILRALLRLDVDETSADKAANEVRDLRTEVDRLGDAGEQASRGVGRAAGAARGAADTGVRGVLGRIPGVELDDTGRLADKTRDQLEFLGDGFEQLIDTSEMLGIELGSTAKHALEAATSLNRISSDPIGAAVNAIGQAVAAFQEFQDEVGQGTQKVSDRWTEFVDDAADGAGSAAELADEYNAAQARVNEQYERGGIVAELFVNRAESVNASQDQLNDAMLLAAQNYDDYRAGVRAVNNNLGDGERAMELLTKTQFDNEKMLMRLNAAYRNSEISLRELADAYDEVGDGYHAMWLRLKAGARELADAQAEIAHREDVFPDAVDAYIEFQEQTAQAQKEWLDARFEATDEHNEAIAEAEAELGEQREAIVDAYSSEIVTLYEQLQSNLVDVEEQGAAERLALTQQYVQAAADAEAAYYVRRQELADNFGLQAARAEEDHQRRIQRMREDTQAREGDAIASRDALALLSARRDFERNRGRADDDFALAQGRRNEDFARQLTQLQDSFEAQRAQREAEYEQRLMELEEQQAQESAELRSAANEQLAVLEEAKAAELQATSDAYVVEINNLRAHLDERQAEINTGYDEEKATLNQAFSEQLADLDANLLGEREMRQAYYVQMTEDLEAWLESNAETFRNKLPGARPPRGGRASGGYVGSGLYEMGEQGREFVMSNQTTQAAERMAGGPLSQAGVLGAMGQQRVINANFNFANEITGAAQDRSRTWVYGVLNDLLGEVE